ncbi:MAG: DUF11 domain-containing protein [Bacteroidetes bacterium]|nr:DUF11 domain-containing protein [Bacteroidota bacterium]
MKTVSTLRRVLLLVCFCVAFGGLQAQYVAIPDTNLGTWLYNNGFSSIMTGSNAAGWQLDASDPLTQSYITIDISHTNITNLEGLQYLTGMTSLYCNYDSIPFINNLPPDLITFTCRDAHVQTLPYPLPYSLMVLDISNNPLLAQSIIDWPYSLSDLQCENIGAYSLPPLPGTLISFSCQDNNLTSLPTLPNGLQHLYCDGNPLYGGLPTLPSGLQLLWCQNAQLTSLPALPSSITEIYCGLNSLTSLPALPPVLATLQCSQNQLTSLPSLPASLRDLDCSMNQLTSIPVLPDAMTALACSSNQITALPAHLPDSLQTLNCSINRLTVLPPLPARLGMLSCDDNDIAAIGNIPPLLSTLTFTYNHSISCLPRITQTLFTTFKFVGTSVQCVPSRFSAQQYDINPGTLPVCDAASGCEFYYNVAGNIHQDISANCTADSLNQGTPVTNIKVQLKQGGNVIQQFYTFSSGGYSFKTPGYGSYTVDVDTTALGLVVACPQIGVRGVAISAIDSVKKYENFGMQCGVSLSGSDYGVTSIAGPLVRPGSRPYIEIYATNLSLYHNINCSSVTPGTVTTTWTNGASYYGPGPGALTPTSVSGQTATYALADLNTLTEHSLDIVLSIDSHAVIGSQICLTTIVSSTPADPVRADDTLTHCFSVSNSLDPNNKDVSPDRLAPGEADWLTYTVHFQNTGNDTAYLVVLKDTLSQYVDAASFQYLASSHHAVVQLEGGAMTFTFPHINLVDSATNPPLSEGWIQYRVRANAGLPNGTAINNTAYIYFDLNPAVVTNTATTTVQLATCVDGDIYDSTTICQGDTFVYGGMTMTTTGFYYNLMQNATGCDTTYHIWLTVLPAAHTTLHDTICAGSSYAFGGHQLTAAGSYLDTLTSAGGCDSIISLALSIRPNGYLLINDTICAGEQYIYLHDTLTTSDSAIYIFHNAYGCDSFVQLILTVRPLPVVHFTFDSLLRDNGVDISTGHSAVICFNPTMIFTMKGGTPEGGHYSGVGIINDTMHTNLIRHIDTIVYTYTDGMGCTGRDTGYLDYRICEGINDIPAKNSIHIYPDPNTGTFTLVTERSYGLSYRVYDVLGKEVLQGSITADTQPIHLPDVAEGVYTISVDGSRPLRFVVVR